MPGKRKRQQRNLRSFWAVPVTAPPYAPPENESAEGTEETEDQERSDEIEDSEDEALEEIQIKNTETEDETEEPAEMCEPVEMSVDTGKKQKIKSGAAIYRCTFKREWTAEWPFITVGTTTSYFWCSICRHENSCVHQGKADVTRHIKSKVHRTKEQAVQSTASIAPYYGSATVGGMTAQEVKVLHAIQLYQL